MTNLTSKDKLFRIVFIIVVLMLYGCDPLYKTQLCKSYVICYEKLDAIGTTVIENSNSFLIHFEYAGVPIRYSCKSKGEEKEIYDALCRKHNDLNYNKHRVFSDDLPDEILSYIDKDFLSIGITTIDDFDELHPAGSDISDIVRFMSWSPIKYINSGYSKYYQYDSDSMSEAFNTVMPIYYGEEYLGQNSECTCYPIDKMVNELTPEDLFLLGDDCLWYIGFVHFEKLPDKQGDYSFNVRMIADTGETLETSVTMTF